VHGANGSAANPSFAFNSDQNTGLYRIGAGNIGVTANGNKVLDIATTGLTVTGALGASSLTSPASSNLTLAGGTAGSDSVVVSNTLAASSAIIGAFKVGNGTAATNVAIGGGNINAGGTGTFGGTVSYSGALKEGSDNVISSAGTALLFGNSATWTETRLGSTSASGIVTLYAGNAERMRIASTGTVTINSSTAGSSGAGALVVTGGLSAGNSGGASYFGGAVNVANDLTVSSNITANSTGSAVGNFNSTAASGAAVRFLQSGAATSYVGSSKYAISNSHTTSDLGLATVAGNIYIAPSGTIALTLATTGAATFAGAVAIGNTVNTVSPTSPNRTITMVVGGVTLYIAAKTTND
jgi:hypothetical protein